MSKLTQQSRLLAICFTLSVLAHLELLHLLTQSPILPSAPKEATRAQKNNRLTVILAQHIENQIPAAEVQPLTQAPPPEIPPVIAYGTQDTQDTTLSATSIGWGPPESYHKGNELTLKPIPLKPAIFDYPPITGDPGSHIIVLQLYINETGVVDGIEVETTNVRQEIKAAAIADGKRIIFSPGEIAGKAVRSTKRIEVTYSSSISRKMSQ